ncbi:ECF-type sigma factor [Roseiconus lacunae]|uniref:ECF-type sigma factor n=1 Tax=Roseiconus lacunae TaxID=2605694 RepID=UPI0011F22C77|nr:ECF-type sigma factor [Roseiconus lacunae]WRQ48621.1 ECF-type sigma factor [Stieleria sp. HD01]
MSERSITLILNRLRKAMTEDERQAAAAELYRCYRAPVEKIARGRLSPGGGLADEEDVAQSAFRSFFDRIETGQLDALVNGGQAWAILARLTRNKAIDSVRYDNALCRGGEGSRRGAQVAAEQMAAEQLAAEKLAAEQKAACRSTASEHSASTSETRVSAKNAGPRGANRLGIADPSETAIRRRLDDRGGVGRREEYPLDAVRDRNQRSGDEQVASDELVERFLEALSEATLRGIVSLKLQGFTNEEIASKLGCATRTVERKLNLIRRLWIPILENADEQRRA